MKTKPKNTGKAKKQPISFKRKKVSSVLAKRSSLRHFKLIEHKHTFKLIHHRHTSHLALVLILVFVGFFMYASNKITNAASSVIIGTIVPGEPPSVGATIKKPNDGATIKDDKIINVSGKCYENSFVIIKNNDNIAGSTICTDKGKFSLQVQLSLGKNILTALNYDNLNQAGPATPSVEIYITETKIESSSDAETTSTSQTEVDVSSDASSVTEIMPDLPDNPSIITGVNSSFLSCDDYKAGKLSTGGELHVAVVCVPRLFMPKIQQVMGVLVWGGAPPYALSVNFGSETDENQESTLLSLAEPGYAKIKFSYAVPDAYKVQFRLTDKKNNAAIVETAVQVNGEQKTSASSIVNNLTKDIFGEDSWFESPVPFYLLAVAVTLGFWGGDLFDRKFGSGKKKARRRATA